MSYSRQIHDRKRFYQELADLNGIVLRMGGLVEDRIFKAMNALRGGPVQRPYAAPMRSMGSCR
ncbi:MAG: hypothetical protein OXI15_13555 [Chromatiales bacterium]|nr:hypothetical protein [Chromatiales bacterium]